MKTLLIVDDEDIILDMLCEFFDFKGFNVLSAENENDAKKIFAEHKDSIEVVILDMLLKHTTSDDLFFHLMKVKPSLKVVISSGLSKDDCDPDVAEKTFSFVKKPYIMEDLYNLIENA